MKLRLKPTPRTFRELQRNWQILKLVMEGGESGAIIQYGEDGTAEGGALDQSFLVLSTDDNLSSERVLVAGDGLTAADAGAGGNLTLAVDDNYFSGYYDEASDIPKVAITQYSYSYSDFGLTPYTDENAQDAINSLLAAGTDIGLSYDDAANTLTISYTGTDTGHTQEEIEDIVGGMVAGNTETFISVTYEDGDGTLDFVVPVKDEDDMASDSADHLATQQSIKAYVDSSSTGYTDEDAQDAVGTILDDGTTGNIVFTYDDATPKIHATFTAGDNLSWSGSTLNATDASLTEEEVEDIVAGLLVAGGNIMLDYDDPANTLTITAVQKTDEEVEDVVGNMLGSESFITVSYVDSSGSLNFAVDVKDEDNMASDSATHLPTQQSVKSYVDSKTGDLSGIEAELEHLYANVAVNAFDVAVQHNLTAHGMANGHVDTFEDENAVNETDSSGETYDSTAELYKPTGTGGSTPALLAVYDNFPDIGQVDILDGFSNTLLESYDLPDWDSSGYTIRGVALDGEDNLLISMRDSAGNPYIKVMQGISGTEDTSRSFQYTQGNDPDAISFDGANLLSYAHDGSDTRVFTHDGVSASATSSVIITDHSIYNLAFDGANLLSVDNNDPDYIYQHDGISDTILDSFDAETAIGAGPHPYGLAWDGSNVLAGHGPTASSEHATRFSGFSNTVDSQIPLPSSSPQGIDWTSAFLANAMQLASETFTAESEPTTARIVIREEDVTTPTLNTDLVAYASKDGGSTWDQVSLIDRGDYGNHRILSGNVDLTSSGTSMRWKISASVELKIHDVGLFWS